jgi:aarF domain-containing kinase
VFDAERFIDVMQAFENFITAAKSGGGEDLKGNMAELGVLQSQPGTSLVPVLPSMVSRSEQPIKARAALAFLLSDKGNFFREFILDEVYYWFSYSNEVLKIVLLPLHICQI